MADNIKANGELLDNLVQNYVLEAINTPITPTGKMGKITNILRLDRRTEIQRWMSKIINNRESKFYSLNDMIRENPDLYFKSLECALSISNDHKTGFCMGYLNGNPDLELDKIVGSEEFIRGQKEGHISRLKTQAFSKLRGYAQVGAILTIAAAIQIKTKDYNFNITDLEGAKNFERINDIREYLKNMGIGSFIYGVYSMVKSGLLNNDVQTAKKLIQEGPFKLHRNPFYTSVMTTLGSIYTSEALKPIQLGDDPDFMFISTALASLVALGTTVHRYVKDDEKILAKTFGKSYSDYKEKTPRYIPNLRNLLK